MAGRQEALAVTADVSGASRALAQRTTGGKAAGLDCSRVACSVKVNLHHHLHFRPKHTPFSRATYTALCSFYVRDISTATYLQMQSNISNLGQPVQEHYNSVPAVNNFGVASPVPKPSCNIAPLCPQKISHYLSRLTPQGRGFDGVYIREERSG